MDPRPIAPLVPACPARPLLRRLRMALLLGLVLWASGFSLGRLVGRNEALRIASMWPRGEVPLRYSRCSHAARASATAEDATPVVAPAVDTPEPPSTPDDLLRVDLVDPFEHHDTDRANGLLSRAEDAYTRGRYAAARALTEQALRLDADLERARMILGAAQCRLGDRLGARRTYFQLESEHRGLVTMVCQERGMHVP